MKLVTCEHPWHNLAAAYATVTNSTLEEVIDFCRHDGSEIIWPNLADPLNRLGFHTQEMIDFCLTKNYFVTAVTREFLSMRSNEQVCYKFKDDWLDGRFHKYMRNYYGVMAFDFGVTVWDGTMLMVPQTGQIAEYTRQTPEVFFIVGKIL